MSDNWSWYVIFLVVANIVGILWLLIATSRSNGIDESESMGHEWDGIHELNNPMPRWWYGLFIITIVFSVVYLYLYPGMGNYKGSLNWTQTSQFEQEHSANRDKQAKFFVAYQDLDIDQLSQNTAAMASGQRLFLNNCATCHGSAGQGAKGFPNLADNDWLRSGDAKTIYATIENGRQGMMPNLGVSKANAQVLARYLRSLSGANVTEFVAERGPQLFVLCAACHGADARGNQALGAPNLRDDIWMHGSSLNEIEHVILNGVQANMPSFKRLLSADEMKLLTAYVLSLQESGDQAAP